MPYCSSNVRWQWKRQRCQARVPHLTTTLVRVWTLEVWLNIHEVKWRVVLPKHLAALHPHQPVQTISCIISTVFLKNSYCTWDSSMLQIALYFQLQAAVYCMDSVGFSLAFEIRCIAAALLQHLEQHFESCTWEQAAELATTLSKLNLSPEHVRHT